MAECQLTRGYGMRERSVYKVVGGEEDVRGIAKRVAQITVSAIKQMPVLAS
jgi:hypothetical protein